MEDVVWVQPEGGGLRLVTLMGQSRLLQAEIMSIDLLHSSIVLQERLSEPQSETAPDREQPQ
jgi:predicted RNA-binding protein